tara:strand:+ start:3010 stop:3429 length:420 start_codon:yes stop_codon:yes gene_type:complete
VKKKKEISDSDKKNWEEYTKDPQDIFDKDLNSKKVNLKATRFTFDLHGYTLREANIKVEEIIISCQEKNFAEILLVTGKGIHSTTEKDTYVSAHLSKLRYSVPDFIQSKPDVSKRVISVSPADTVDGGNGALIIKLKKL